MTSTPSSADTSFLTALRLADSFLPVGAYTASYGLEQYINETDDVDVDEIEALLEEYLHYVVGPSDVIALANAYDAAAAGDLEALCTVDQHLHAATLPREFRESSTKAGGQLLDLFGAELEEYTEAVEAGETPGTYVVVLAAVAKQVGISRAQTAQIHAYSFIVGLLGAAQRLSRLGHTDVQMALEALLPVMSEVCDQHIDEPLSEIRSFAPTIEIMGMRHEHGDVRLFMS